jgi:hypothetical protein
LTDVTDLDRVDPSTGHALFQVSWKPLGQDVSSDAPARDKNPSQSTPCVTTPTEDPRPGRRNHTPRRRAR